MKRCLALVLSLILLLSLAACGGKEDPAPRDKPSPVTESASEPSQTPEPSPAPEGSGPPVLPEDLHEDRFTVRGNNAQAAQVVITAPESWWASNANTLSSRIGWSVKFESVTTAPADREAFLRGKEAELGEVIASGGLESLGLDGWYYHFLQERFDGVKEDRVQYFVFDGDSVADFLLLPFPDADLDAQREELEAFLGTMRFGPLDPETPADPGEEEGGGEENALWFGLGPEGEAKALRAGDILGGWTLQSYKAQWDSEDIPRVNEAVFIAPTGAPMEISCTVSLDPMSSDRNYWFTVAEEDLDKMPVMRGDGRDVWFSGRPGPALDALAELTAGETRSCRVAVSRYTFVYLPMMSSNGADIVWVELE